MRRSLVLAVLLSALLVPGAGADPAIQTGSWRSSLYPENWTPGYADPSGRFLHDFSYAGYHAGEKPIPRQPPGIRIDVTRAPYRADNTGVTDATVAIQLALDEAGARGGGVVYLPPGDYRITPQGNATHALRIRHSGVVLRGAGPDNTRLFLGTSNARGKATIRVAPAGPINWGQPVPGSTRLLASDLNGPATVLPLRVVPPFEPGDWVMIRHDTTEAWNHDHRMDCASFPPPCWQPNFVVPASFYRRVVAVDRAANTITVDAPTRYFLRTRDRARVYRVAAHLDEVGIEDLAIGEQEHPGECVSGNEENNPAFPCNYETHGHDMISFDHVVNSWVRDVRSYSPASNPRGYHLLSDGIELLRSRHVTVEETDLRKPQNRGGGGNGYMYIHQGNDNLIQRAAGYEGRHNFSFKTAFANGNVIRDSYAFKGSLNSDFHHHLSMANLVENVRLDQEIFEARWRGASGNVHGQSGTQNVFWNITSVAARGTSPHSLISDQFNWGLSIGTRGAAPQVRLEQTPGRTEPLDFVEGVGAGATLMPQSLYLDQLGRRCRASPHQPVPPCVPSFPPRGSR